MSLTPRMDNLESKDILLRQLLAKNHILNGGMEISQKNGFGTIVHTTSDDLCDMFRCWFGFGAISRTIETVAGVNNIKLDVTSSGTPSAGQSAFIRNYIEGYNLRYIAGKTVTIAFDVYGKAGTYSLSIRNGGSTRSYVAEYTIDQDSAWQTIVINVPIDTSVGTWDFDNNVGMQINWVISCGSEGLTSTLDEWTSDGNKFAGSNQFNGMGGTGTDYDFKLRKVALYEGEFTTDTLPEFRTKHQSYQKELAECQRYLELNAYKGRAFSNGETDHWITFMVTKRATPGVATWNHVGYSSAPNPTEATLWGFHENSWAAGGSNLAFDMLVDARM